MFRYILKLACLALMAYVGYYLWRMDPAQTRTWAESNYPWIRDVSRVLVAFLGASFVGGVAWKLTDGLVSLFDKK